MGGIILAAKTMSGVLDFLPQFKSIVLSQTANKTRTLSVSNCKTFALHHKEDKQ